MNKLIKNFTMSVNNLTILLYLVNVIFISLIFNNPFITSSLLVILLIMSWLVRREKFKNFLLASLTIFLLTVLFNLFVNQNGSNILFKIPFLTVSTQSITNGFILGISFMNILWSFYLYDALTHTKLIFEILSNVFKSIAIIFILTVKFIPKIIDIFRDVRQLYKFRNSAPVRVYGFSKWIKQTMNLNEIVLNKSISNFMNMSDSLISKGYNQRRQSFVHETNKLSDYILRVVMLVSIAFNIVMITNGFGQVNFGSGQVNFKFDIWIALIILLNFLAIVYPLLIGEFHYLWWKSFISRTTASSTPTVQKYR
ncbi:energy-coupling factor transporter transmembrane component T [Companilactobacillus sp.]|uniref:energy-coupling factor transporter transmembrane component T n=1 Tax=Companilactobacillus sp. TaxID=2767905 RepID=UPI0026097CD4|nr:energy-coupling factor transporter transmembrane component T [Companilactobacillus sp.]